MSEIRQIAAEIKFPEGPIAMPDGRFVVAEVLGGNLLRIDADGKKTVIAHLGGGPNGAAIGPDGRCYVCNNGGITTDEIATLMSDTPDAHLQPGEPRGRIEVVDLDTGEYAVLYKTCGAKSLIAPNDIVFDAQGGFYFTDFGSLKVRKPQRSALYYARSDGSRIDLVVDNLERANGVALSPDESRVYVAETSTGSVWSFAVTAPGVLELDRDTRTGGDILFQDPSLHLDSMAVDARGYVCVATTTHASILRIAPDGRDTEHVAIPGGGTTNICFGGKSLDIAYVTVSIDGRLVSLPWQCPGAPLNFLNR
jgi:gluconolactonase